MKQEILIFGLSLPKGYFWSKAEKVAITIEFSIFELAYVLKFIFNKKFSIFEATLVKMGIFGRKQKS